ncbi:hypothetical protein BG005_003276 [Podila minutissima]|nr:hypothetical protein BG005_003276 [Podila minutissima]
METTPAASQAPTTAVPEVGIQPVPMTCNPAHISAPDPNSLTAEQLWGTLDLSCSNLLDTSLTNLQLVAELNTSIGFQPIGTQDQSEIEPPVVRNFKALYRYTEALIYSVYSCQSIPQSKAAPSEAINPVVLGKRARRNSPSDEGASEESSAEDTTLPKPQSDEQKPTKKRKTSTTTTRRKKAVSTPPRAPTTKHRNSFILYRCLLSKIKKWIQEQDPGVGGSSIPPKKQPAEHQCVFSKRVGTVYKTPCRGANEGSQWCNCANCLMRKLFERAAAQLKDDVHLVEAQLRTTPNPLQAEFVPNRQRIDQAINWAVFEQIYYQSDLFRGHLELNVGGHMLTVEQIRAIWMENEVEEQRKKFDAVKREFL